MDDLQQMLREYADLDYEIEDAKTTYMAYSESAVKKKRELDELQKRSAEIQHKIGEYMTDNGLVEEKFGNATVAPRKLPDLLYIRDAEQIPKKFVEEKTKVTQVIDKTAIKKAIVDGEFVAGATIIKKRYGIKFKNIKIKG